MKPRSSSSTPVPAPSRSLRVRTATDRDHQAVDREALLALGIGVDDLDRAARGRHAGDLGAEAHVQPLLLQVPQRFLGELLIGDGQKLRQGLEHRHLEPSRRHTLPSSRPMTPAPITPRRLGTASKSSAPQESTI